MDRSPSLVGGPFLTGESTHEKWTPPSIGSCLSVLCLIFHVSMKVMDKDEFVFMRFLLGKRGNIILVNSPFKPYFFIQLNQ